VVGYSRIEVVKMKEAIIIRHDARIIVWGRALEHDTSSGNGAAIDIDYRTDNGPSLWFRCGDLLPCSGTDDRYAEKKSTKAKPGTHQQSALLLTVHLAVLEVCSAAIVT
jgi:hypothetical protein